MSIGILTNGTTFTLASSAINFKCREDVLNGLEKYVKQIDTSKYGDYRMTDIFCKESSFQRGSDMRVTCAKLFQS